MAALTDTGDLQISNLCSIVHVFVEGHQHAGTARIAAPQSPRRRRGM